MTTAATLDLPAKVLTLDMDGTVFDPWACCGHKDHTYVGTPECRHLRQDTVERIEAVLAEHPDAAIVVLSWRSGMQKVTAEWLGYVGIEPTHYFIPGTDDTAALGAVNAGQVGFKVNVVKALIAQGVEIVAGFEDNPEVVEALNEAGAPVERVEHLVEVHFGRMGPAPEQGDWYNQPTTIPNFEPELDWDACNRMPTYARRLRPQRLYAGFENRGPFKLFDWPANNLIPEEVFA